MTHSTRAISLASLGILLLAGWADAQERRELSQAEICAAAAKVVAIAHDPRVLSAAYLVLSRCPNAAANLASVWATPPADAGALAQLARKSADLSDRRVLEATLPIMQNAALPQAARRAALDVVLAQYSPRMVISSDTWMDPEHNSLGIRSDYFQAPGEQPITAADRQRILATFRAMSISATDIQWRRVAKRVDMTLSATP